MDARALSAKAIELSKLAVRMTTQAGAGHPSSALSLAHIVTVLMYKEMRYDPTRPDHPQADRLVLSEGHAVPIVYAAYADLGGTVGRLPDRRVPLTLGDLGHLREWDSVLDGHPNPAEGFPFFDAATGSLGMGLSVAAGLALAARLDQSPRRVYCLIGDGESREGQIWEALDCALDWRLNNLCAVFNCNGEGQAGRVSPQQSADVLVHKLAAFGWTTRMVDGHAPEELVRAFEDFHQSATPLAIVARTVKGWGVQPLQGGNFHGKPLPEADLADAEASLDAMHHQLGTSPAEAATLKPPVIAPATVTGGARAKPLPDFEQALSHVGLQSALEHRKLATRRAYGVALSALGQVNPAVVALDGDVSNSTFADIFAARHEARFFEGKIAEQNLISAAVGLAAGGKVPFVSSFAKFLARGYDQIELALISRANIKLVGSHSGLGPASDGPSQMALADLACFRPYTEVDDGRRTPACVVFQPADAIAAYRMTGLMADHRGPCYMRTHRPDVPFIYPFDERFEVGGSKILRRGDHVTLVASGYMVTEALQAATLLADRGINSTVIDAYSLPLDTAPVLGAAADGGSIIVTLEDNYGGGFGSAVAQAAAETAGIRVHCLTVPRIPKSAATPQVLLDHYGLSAPAICTTVAEFLGR